MGKKQPTGSQAAAKAAKKAKAAQKVEKKETKKVLKSKNTGAGGSNAPKKSKPKKKRRADDSDTDGDDLEGILEKMRREWEDAHIVTEELVEGPPSRRANATLTACPNGSHLWCIGGEFFSEDGKAYFYNDVFRYTPDKQEWRKFVSPTCPGPRSAHAVVASPAGGGKLFLFGGEFSSLHQNSFHHYRDFWCFDIGTHIWDRIETKVRPSARSGHRMAVWKQLIVLFGGFYDPGITTRYLNDLWVFDTQEYKWTQVALKETDPRPSPRSGFSFLPCADGIVLHGGYCKEYSKGKRPIGVMLDDTWLLKMTLPSDAPPPTPTQKSTSKTPLKPPQSSPTFKWEKRKRPSDAYAPSLRSGCTMTLWAAKSMGVLFGGVTDEDTSEEGLESVFWNDMYSYQLIGKGRWNSLTLKKPKTKGVGRKESKAQKTKIGHDSDDDEDDGGKGDEELILSVPPVRSIKVVEKAASNPDADDPFSTTPMPRYNTMLAVLRNTLYIYGGIFERGSHEYTLDDFYSIQLDKMDRFMCLKKSEIAIPDEAESSSEDEEDDGSDSGGDDDGDDDSDDEESEMGEDRNDECGIVSVGENGGNGFPARDGDNRIDGPLETPNDQEMKAAMSEMDKDLRSQPTTVIGASSTLSAEDVQSTPLPGETLAVFYARTREYWAQKAIASSDNKGKQLRREGFTLAEERYVSYKPILEEVEKILAEAGLDEDEMRKGAAGAPPAGGAGLSRNRR